MEILLLLNDRKMSMDKNVEVGSQASYITDVVWLVSTASDVGLHKGNTEKESVYLFPTLDYEAWMHCCRGPGDGFERIIFKRHS